MSNGKTNWKLESIKFDARSAREKRDKDIATKLKQMERRVKAEADYLANTAGATDAANALMATLPGQLEAARAVIAAEYDAAIMAARDRVPEVATEIRRGHAVTRHLLNAKLFPPVSDDVARTMAARLAAVRSLAELNQVWSDARAANDIESVAFLEQSAEPHLMRLTSEGYQRDIALLNFRNEVESARKERGGEEWQAIADDEAAISETESFAKSYMTSGERQGIADMLHMDVKNIPDSAPLL